MSFETVYLQREDENVPWGFRLLGGSDFQQPLAVQRVTAGSVASTGLSSGDVITRIGEVDTGPLTHAQSMQAIKNSGNVLQLCIAKGAAAAIVAQCPPTPSTPQTASGRHDSPQLYNNSSLSPAVGYPFGSPQYSGPQSPSSNVYGGGPGLSSVQNGQSGYDGQDNGQNFSQGYASPQYGRQSSQQQHQQQQQQQQHIPDAVLNMAARGPADKKPFTYVADVNDIKEQRDRVRKKGPSCAMPRYQQMLNLPQFDDAPRARGLGRTTPATPPVLSDTAVVANLQFNSPMGMYSGDNVMEALKGQTGSQVTDVVGLPRKEKGDITQSPVYKMIHGIDQPKPKAAIVYAEAHDSPLRGGGPGQQYPQYQPHQQYQQYPQQYQQQAEDDLRAAGLNKPVDVPSRTFQMLQQSVGGPDPRDSPSRLNVASGDEMGEYDQKSIRYTGKNIPSKSFRMLQTLTRDSPSPQSLRQASSTPDREPADYDENRFSGLRHVPTRNMQDMQLTDDEPRGGSEIDTSSIRHNLRPVDGDGQEPGQYDETSIRYTGKTIPSKSFRMLQSLTGGDTPPGSCSPASRRQQRRPQQMSGDGGQAPNNQDEGVKDVRYAGSNIPSQSFKMLQNYVSDSPDHSAGEGDGLQAGQGRRMKVVTLRQQSKQPQPEDSGSTEF